MPTIIFTDVNGGVVEVNATSGESLMQAARDANIEGIDAHWGGQCACATCHVYVDEAWKDKTGESSAMEESMLDFAENVEPNSRLSCQIKVSDALDGLIVRLPESQH